MNKKLQITFKSFAILLAVCLSIASVADEVENNNNNNNNNQFDNISLLSETNEQIQYESDHFYYDEAAQLLTLSGNVILSIPAQNLEISAGQIIYNTATGEMDAVGNVLIKGHEQVTFTKHATFNLGQKEAHFEETLSSMELVDLKAKEGKIKSTDSHQTAVYKNGNFKLAKPVHVVQIGNLSLAPIRFYQAIEKSAEIANDYEHSIINERNSSFYIDTNKVSYTPDRVQNNIFLSGGMLRLKNAPLSIPFPPWFYTAGQSSEQMLTAIMGNNPRTGAGDFNLGPKLNFVLGDPTKKRAVHFAPFVQFGDSLGYGGLLGYNDKRTNALIAYGASKKRLLAEIDFKITQYNKLIYGHNSYVSTGITKHYLELNDQRHFDLPVVGRFLENNGVNLKNEVNFIEDSQSLRDEENNLISDLQRDSVGQNNLAKNKIGGRFQSNISFTTKPLLQLGTDAYNFALAVGSNSSFRAYTQGNLNAFTTISPNTKIHLSRFADFELAYNQLFAVGKSPFGFDQMVQGNSSISFNTDLNLFKWLAIGGGTIYSLSRKNLTAQQVRLTIGPDDFKVLLSFDPVYKRVNFGLNLLITDPVKFKSMEYKQRTKHNKK